MILPLIILCPCNLGALRIRGDDPRLVDRFLGRLLCSPHLRG